MAKGFHYFKFIATEWLTGDIAFEDFELQGIFINICAIYWHRNGKVSLDELVKRLKTERISALTDRFISVNEGFISIKFLDEQLLEAGHISKKNSDNGKKGGRPKSAPALDKKPTALRPITESKANESQIELEIELERELELKEKIQKAVVVPTTESNKIKLNERALKFKDTLKPFKDKYPIEMLKEFYEYWIEPNPSFTKMRKELEKTWDLSRRLGVWSSRVKIVGGKEKDNSQLKKSNYVNA